MTILPHALARQMAEGRAPAVLDVRSTVEFRNGHLPGAIHVPFWVLPWRLSRLSLRPDAPVVVYCGHGPRAWMAAAYLRHRGFRQVHALEGHVAGWRRAGLRLTGADDAPRPAP